MQRYLTNFAKTGDPNGEGLPLWQTRTQAEGRVLVLGDESIEQQDADSVIS